MTSAFFGLDIALRALRSHQRLVDVTNHNIANANTPGFSRQVATLQASLPFPVPAANAGQQTGQIGTGVEVAAIRRARDVFTDYQVRGEVAARGRWDARNEALRQTEVIFNEPSPNGLRNLLGRYWQAWQETANNPSERAPRANLVQVGEALADGFHRMDNQLTTLQRDTDTLVGLTVQEVNLVADQLAALNRQVAQLEGSGMQANDLRDQRDQLVDRLSELARVTSVESAEGSLSIFLGGRQLVDRTRAHHLAAVTDPGQPFATVEWAEDGGTVELSHGKLKGILESRDETGRRLDELHALARRVIASVNGLHVSGVGLDGSQGVAFFAGTDARTIGVNGAVAADLNQVAAARRQPDGSYAAGDNSTALAVARLQHSLAQPTASSTLRAGATLDGGNVRVAGLDVAAAAPGTAFTLSAAGSTLTVSTGAASASFTIGAADLDTAGKVLVLDAASLGIRITLAADAPATPSAVAADLAALTVAVDSASSSIGDQYGAQVTRLGVDARAARAQAANQQLLVDHLKRRRDEISGVSLDEETGNLIRAQHAYQAAARAVSVMDDMLDRLINGTGRVGR